MYHAAGACGNRKLSSVFLVPEARHPGKIPMSENLGDKQALGSEYPVTHTPRSSGISRNQGSGSHCWSEPIFSEASSGLPGYHNQSVIAVPLRTEAHQLQDSSTLDRSCLSLLFTSLCTTHPEGRKDHSRKDSCSEVLWRKAGSCPASPCLPLSSCFSLRSTWREAATAMAHLECSHR